MIKRLKTHARKLVTRIAETATRKRFDIDVCESLGAGGVEVPVQYLISGSPIKDEWKIKKCPPYTMGNGTYAHSPLVGEYMLSPQGKKVFSTADMQNFVEQKLSETLAKPRHPGMSERTRFAAFMARVRRQRIPTLAA